VIGEYNSKKIAEEIIKMYSEKKNEDISRLISKSVLAKDPNMELPYIGNTMSSNEKSLNENKGHREFEDRSLKGNTHNEVTIGNKDDYRNSGFQRTQDFEKSRIDNSNGNIGLRENLSLNQSDKGSFLLERERGRFEEKSRKNAEFSMKYEEILRKNDRKKEEKGREVERIEKEEDKGDEGAKYKEIIKKYIKKSNNGEKKGFVLDENNRINKYESLFLIAKNDDNKVFY